MKKILIFSALIAFMVGISMQTSLAETPTSSKTSKLSLKKVDANQVCMVNNTFLARQQIPVVVTDQKTKKEKTYYGCCEMCKTRLQQDESARKAFDAWILETKKKEEEVDKADAIIAADETGKAYYFKNEENWKKFRKKKGL